ncbi:MAG: Rieske (2Fe-2S) protein [Ardenticatenaceae bacterium]
MAEWVPVARQEALLEGCMYRVHVGDRPIVLAQIQGQVRAFDARCPHASADLAEGDLRPGYVICPLHAYRYDLRTGRCLKPPDGPRLRVYEVRVQGEIVWVKG